MKLIMTEYIVFFKDIRQNRLGGLSFEGHDHNLKQKYNVNLICGVDEAGRGPLAGPVVAAAVIIDYHDELLLVNDSKS